MVHLALALVVSIVMLQQCTAFLPPVALFLCLTVILLIMYAPPLLGALQQPILMETRLIMFVLMQWDVLQPLTHMEIQLTMYVRMLLVVLRQFTPLLMIQLIFVVVQLALFVPLAIVAFI